MKLIRYSLVAVVLCAVSGVPALATEVGDPAPPLKIKEWVKGKPVDLKAGQGEKVYVVEFWATWCAPCLTSIPHLTELQEKNKDKGVVVVGVTSSDKDLETVDKFVEKMGSKMDYVVAYDDSRKTSNAYMKAFGVRGIPHAFIINKQGLIVWHGHPMAGLDKALKEVLAGKFDLEEAKKEFRKLRELARKVEKAEPMLNRYFELITSSDSPKGTDELITEFMPLIEENAQILNSVSWAILTRKGVQHRDLKLALRMATLAKDLTGGKDANTLDTYARALWETGKKHEAVKYQKQAVELAEGDQMKAELNKTLRKYEEELDEKK